MVAKYVVVGPGGNIELLNGDIRIPHGSLNEAWAVFRVTASNGSVNIETVKHRGNVEFNLN